MRVNSIPFSFFWMRLYRQEPVHTTNVGSPIYGWFLIHTNANIKWMILGGSPYFRRIAYSNLFVVWIFFCFSKSWGWSPQLIFILFQRGGSTTNHTCSRGRCTNIVFSLDAFQRHNLEPNNSWNCWWRPHKAPHVWRHSPWVKRINSSTYKVVPHSELRTEKKHNSRVDEWGLLLCRIHGDKNNQRSHHWGGWPPYVSTLCFSVFELLKSRGKIMQYPSESKYAQDIRCSLKVIMLWRYV